MKLQGIMIHNVIQIAPDECVAAAAKRMSAAAVGCLVVTMNDAVKGIATDRDLIGCLAQGHDPFACKISSHMRRPVIVVGPEEEGATAAAVMSRRHIKRLPVARDGKLLGIVALSDLAALADEKAKKLGTSLDFFNAVIRARSSQRDLPREPSGHEAAVPPVVSSADTSERNDLFDAGGPG
jgi:signal-transduction protein with cAMP-binding, CBS, and nucleotidyltransferase domain